jgi:hypothetical protein
MWRMSRLTVRVLGLLKKVVAQRPSQRGGYCYTNVLRVEQVSNIRRRRSFLFAASRPLP